MCVCVLCVTCQIVPTFIRVYDLPDSAIYHPKLHLFPCLFWYQNQTTLEYGGSAKESLINQYSLYLELKLTDSDKGDVI